MKNDAIMLNRDALVGMLGVVPACGYGPVSNLIKIVGKRVDLGGVDPRWAKVEIEYKLPEQALVPQEVEVLYSRCDDALRTVGIDPFAPVEWMPKGLEPGTLHVFYAEQNGFDERQALMVRIRNAFNATMFVSIERALVWFKSADPSTLYGKWIVLSCAEYHVDQRDFHEFSARLECLAHVFGLVVCAISEDRRIAETARWVTHTIYDQTCASSFDRFDSLYRKMRGWGWQ